MPLKLLLEWGTGELKNNSSTPRLDAELLLCYASGLKRIQLITCAGTELSAAQVSLYRELIARRLGHEPVAYLTGTKEFWGLPISVTPEVLIPRPETELLVEESLKVLPAFAEPLQILDLGTGSGCIALALAAELKKLSKQFCIKATDISSAALIVARKNAAQFNFADVITFEESDLFSKMAGSERFDLIVSNPPYIAPDDLEISAELQYEPAGALFCPDSGLAIIKRILSGAPQFLKPQGRLLFEIGSRQTSAVLAWVKKNTDLADPVILRDLAGLDRALVF